MANRIITILTVGSRGDVQPYIALGLGLQQAGYQVRLATETGFEGLVRGYGLNFAPLQAEFLRLAQSPEGKAALSGKQNPLTLMKQVMPMLRRMMDDAWEVARDSDAIIYHPKALAGYHIAEKLSIPGFLAMMLPAYSKTGAFANPVFGAHNFGSWLNRLTYDAFRKASLISYRGMINTWRKETLDLPPFKDEMTLHGKPVPKIYAYSRHVVPIPSDWDDSTFVSGYWFLPASSDWQPPADLLAFLQQGTPPIYVGFGSMPSQDAQRTTNIVLEAARRAGQRVILATGWGGLQASAIPATAYLLNSAPHDWLFPRCLAVVHHGGAGTTAAGLRAGKPTVICPFFGDQPFWGQRVFELGVGPCPIPQKKLSVENLAQAISTATTDEKMHQCADVLGQKIRAEDGVAQAIQFINAHR
jgi:sterol 3beta-glucosyltransferase